MSGGYFQGERGAYLWCALWLVRPEATPQVFRGKVEGQFELPRHRTRPEPIVPDIERYFVPDGETAALAFLAPERRDHYSEEKRAFAALGQALCASSRA
jgi:inosine/xanthosine triphosphate pyrophosphatase family protein